MYTRTFLFIVLSVFLLPATGYADVSVWQDISVNESRNQADSSPTYYRALSADLSSLQAQFAAAPEEFTTTQGAEIALPMPDGSFQRFQVVESPIMESGLALQFPEIRTYRARGIDDPTATGRLDITPSGFHAMIQGVAGTVFIDPESDPNHYRSYFKSDFVTARRGEVDIPVCGVHGNNELGTGDRGALDITLARTGDQLREYRLAVAATGEYTTFHGGTVGAGQAAIVTAINRVNQIYERDLAVRLTLVANNNNLVYTDSVTDPYDNSNGIVMLGQNQTNIDTIIGVANYDIGHVFSTGGGGIASLSSVCGGLKAYGVTGLPSPTGDPFYIDYVAHEIGHQFGGNHSFNGTTSNCVAPNRNAATAFEPGSGSTIMAYAGICGAENVQNNSEATFHAGSIEEILTFIAGAGSVCDAPSATGNSPPDANAGNDYTVPCGTPFVLTGSASDPNGDPLTYQWDQMDAGSSTDSTTYGTDLGDNALFRSFTPRANEFRHFPRLIDQLAHRRDKAETLPATSRTLDFRLTVRDGNMGVDEDDMRVTVDIGSGPFSISSLSPSQATYNSADAVTVNWEVAGSDGAPVNCAAVDIDILWFNPARTQYCAQTLADNTPNDGSQQVSIPAFSNGRTRFRVMCSDNVFYDITDSDVTVNAAVAASTNCINVDASGGISTDAVVAGSCPGGSGGSVVVPGGGGGGGAVGYWWLALLGIVLGRTLFTGLYRSVQSRFDCRFPHTDEPTAAGAGGSD